MSFDKESVKINIKKDGYRQLNVRQLGSSYAPGNIAVNVTWIEREFNACQTHRSMYTPIFNRLRAIARYWSEIATFSYPLAFNTPVRSGPWDNRGKCHTVGKRIQYIYCNTFTAIVRGPYTGKVKMCKKCAKMANF